MTIFIFYFFHLTKNVSILFFMYYCSKELSFLSESCVRVIFGRMKFQCLKRSMTARTTTDAWTTAITPVSGPTTRRPMNPGLLVILLVMSFSSFSPLSPDRGKSCSSPARPMMCTMQGRKLRRNELQSLDCECFT